MGYGQMNPPCNSNPPSNCGGGNFCVHTCCCQTRIYGGGGSNNPSLSSQDIAHINRALSFLGSFLEDGRISVSVEIEALRKLIEPVVVNSGSGEVPLQRVNLEFRVGRSNPIISSKVNDDAH